MTTRKAPSSSTCPLQKPTDQTGLSRYVATAIASHTSPAADGQVADAGA